MLKFDFTKEYYPFATNVKKAKELQRDYKNDLIVKITKDKITIKFLDRYLGISAVAMSKIISEKEFLVT